MAEAFSPDLFSDFRRTSSPHKGRGTNRRGRGHGKRGRGKLQTSFDRSQESVAPSDPTPETKRIKRNKHSLDTSTIEAISDEEVPLDMVYDQ